MERSKALRPILFLLAFGAACSDAPASRETPPRVAARTHTEPATIEVFAAASLRDVMADLATLSASHGEARITFNFAGSNVLAQQLAASSRGDVFVSADDQWVAFLETGGHAEPGTRAVVASNTLAVVAHPASTFALTSIEALSALSFAPLSLADPGAVPAGRYAKAYLASVRSPRGTVWDAVASRVAPTADVRAALALVATQEDVVGIVYRTDARAGNVRVLLDVPPEALPSPVRYTAVAVRGRSRLPASRAFVALLLSPEGQAVFARHGFLPSPGAQPPTAR
jgi:molybdate transport system substrate-binding protein